ncbi:Serine/threonine-protein kinase PLK4, partial [Symbiodinium microadriaticum]
ILKAVEYLHEHNVGHRDISLENLLLRQGQVRLMDFGQAVLLRDAAGNAHYYFRLCGG